MAAGICPKCSKVIDYDGFSEHHEPVLFYCECGSIFDSGEEFLSFVEIPKEEVDLTEIKNWPIAESTYCSRRISRGTFIKKSRWKNWK